MISRRYAPPTLRIAHAARRLAPDLHRPGCILARPSEGDPDDPLLFHPAPNPTKIVLFLAEAGLPYETIPVDTSKGEQHLPAFRAINPNGKVPTIVDTEGPGGKEARVFDSTAILLYLAEKTGNFLGTSEDRSELLSWLLFIASGLGRSPGRPCTSSSLHPRGWLTL